jgi:uncharacterized protein (TIGR03437 family)
VSVRIRFLFILLAVATAVAQTDNSISGSFFGISALGGSFPAPTVGALGHPEFSWAQMEPAAGNFDFSRLDAYVVNAQHHGLVDATNTAAVVFALSAGTPAWAVADQSSCTAGVCTAPPDNPQDWKDYVSALLQHYNGQTQPHIRYYELWNEANSSGSWTGTNAQMVSLAQGAYAVVHADRNSLLLTPSVVGMTQVSWMTAYLKAGGGNYADGGAFHGYIAVASAAPYPMPEDSGCQGCYGSIVTMATAMRNVLDTYGLATKPMLMTEGSWGGANLSSTTQTEWLARYVLLLAGLRISLNLPTAVWYAWGDPGLNWGTLTTPGMQPTVAGLAYRQLYNWLAGATALKPCSSAASGTWTCNFTRPGGYVAQAVWNTQGYISYFPGLSFVQYRDLEGNTKALTAGGFIDVGPEPVLFEGTSAGTGLAPVISLVANAEGEAPAIAPNTWVEVKGINLARVGDARIWQDSDFVRNQLPAQMDGVSVTVSGKAAYIYYVSPTQVNILTPPDAISGNVPVQVTYNGITSPAVNVPAQAVAPSFFVFQGGPYAAATHANGTLLGPAALFPGLSTPASPGDVIVLYGNGFGATDTPVQAGLPVQSGKLPTLPAIQIGGVNAAVLFAGLIGPGQYQFNVQIPASLTRGDQPLVATYQGFSTQPGLLISLFQ